MFKSARSRLRAAVFACAAALGLGAYAAPTATAVWRSNLGQSYTIGGNTFAVAPNGGALQEDGTIKMGTENSKLGATIALPAGTRNVSVLVKFSNLSIPTDQQYGTALATINDSSFHEVGVAAANTSSLNTYWHENGSSTYEISAVYSPASPAVVSSGYMLFSYAANNGSRCYMGETIASLAGGENTTGHWSNLDVQYVSIGGPTALQILDICDNLVIEEVALFVGNYLTNTDVADYAFPTLDGETTALTMTELNTKIAADSNVIFTASPVVTLDVEPSDATKTYLQSAAWNGTVLIKDTDKDNIVPSNYGNPNSTLKLSGVKGFFAKAKYANTVTPAIELEDSATDGREYGFWSYDGYGFNAYNVYPRVNTPELKGSGTYKCDKANLRVLLVADKFCAFSGKFVLSNGGAVCLETGVPTESDESVLPGRVYLGGSVPAKYSEWTVSDGFYGTVEVAANDTNNASDLFASSVWNGTVVVPAATNSTTGHIHIMLAKLGNANSVVQFNGLTSDSKDYYLNSGDSPTYNTTVDVNGWVAFANGSSGKTITFSKVTGSNADATLRLAFPGTALVNYTITTLDQFAGTLSVNGYAPLTIGTINLATAPDAGAKVVKLVNGSYLKNVSSTKVSVNGVVDDTIALEVKSDGIYVVVPATTVDITIPEVDNATVSVTTNGVAVTPVNGVVTVDIGAAVVVTYTADEGYQLTGDAISFTASASTTTVDVSNISVAAIVANVTSTDGQTTTPYTSAASAIAAADDGETVTLLEATVTLTEVVAINKSIILSGNASGTTITGLNTSAYPTLGAADLTIGANVTFGSQLRVTSGDATITYPTGSVPNYRPPSGYQSQTTDNANDTSTITFYQQIYVVAAGTNATLADENGNQLGSHTPVASGDTFVFTVTPAAGCTLVRVTADGVELTPSEGKYSISIGSSNVSIYAVAGVAVVTGGDSDVYCSSLQAAVAAATSGQTVTLLADVTLDATVVVTNSLTLDLNGYDIAATDARALWIKAGTVSITGEGEISANATENSSFKDSSSVIRVGDSAVNANAASLTIGADVTVSSGHCYGITAFGKNTPGISLVVNGTVSVTGTASAISGNGSSGLASANITVNSGAVVSATADAGIYFPGTGTLSIAGGTITGPTAVYVKCGTVNVTGGTLTGTAAKAAYAYNGDGLNATGDALVIDTCGYPGNPATVSVTGGTFTSQNADAVASYKKGDDAKYADDTVNEAATGFVSGGTFNTAVADTYCAEGFEPKDNGNGKYGVRVDKGWIYEDAYFPGYTGSWSKDGAALDLAYDSETGKAAIEDGATYTASNPSDGQMVTVAMTISFDDANDEDEDVGDAKAAVRLASGETSGTYQFQLYTTNELGAAAWANATAGVTATTNEDYTFVFVLDLTNKVYTASIVDGTTTNVMTVGGATNIPFAYQGDVTPVQKIEFIGAGSVTSIKGSYEDASAPVEEFDPADPIGDVVLSADQATWLNDQSNYAALAAKIATMSQAAFDAAHLLNLNILDENYQDYEEGDFVVTDFRFETEEDVDYVVVEVTLERHGALDGGINGVLKLMGTSQLGTPFTEKATSSFTFIDSGTTTLKYEKDDTTLFYKPVIE